MAPIDKHPLYEPDHNLAQLNAVPGSGTTTHQSHALSVSDTASASIGGGDHAKSEESRRLDSMVCLRSIVLEA